MTDRRRFAALVAAMAIAIVLAVPGPGRRTAAAGAAEAGASAPSAPSAAAPPDSPGSDAAPAATDDGSAAPALKADESLGLPGIELPPGGTGAGSASASLPPAAPRPRSEIERLWLDAGARPERVARAQGIARQLGVASFDGAARALLLDARGEPGPDVAHDAVRLAPLLPFARGEEARALLRSGDPIGALLALARGVATLDGQLESSLWLRAHALHALALALSWGGLAFLCVAGAASTRRASHEVGDVLSDEIPPWRRFLLVGALVLLPASLGQGAFGLALGFLALALLGGDAGWSPAVAVAAAACWLGAQPATSLAARAIAAFDGDPVAVAAASVEAGSAHAGELARLEAATDDLLAVRALAVHARRTGALGLADERYAVLLAQAPHDATLLNNAANVRLALDESDAAIRLYERAVAERPSAIAYFNLSHAYGARIRSSDQDYALARAQAIDRELVGELTSLEANVDTGLAIDLPTPLGVLRDRLQGAATHDAVAAELRRGFAPGWLGQSPLAMALATGGVGAGAWLLGRGRAPTRWCRQCGARCCPRCDDPPENVATCRDCARTPRRKDGHDTARRSARLASQRDRERRLRPLWLAGSLLLPGVAGLRARRPMLGVVGAIGFALAIAASPLGSDAPVDPLAAGLPGRAALLLLALVGALVHLGCGALASAARRS